MSKEPSGRSANQPSSSDTITIPGPSGTSEDVPALRLRLQKPRSRKSVQWTEATVDNEHMNKKKSKCCCIFEKPRSFGDSSSDEDDDEECDNCHGHVEKRKKHVVGSTDVIDTILSETIEQNIVGTETLVNEILEELTLKNVKAVNTKSQANGNDILKET